MTQTNLETSLSAPASVQADETHTRLLQASQSSPPDLTKDDPLRIGGKSPSSWEERQLRDGNQSGAFEIKPDDDSPVPKDEAQVRALTTNPEQLAKDIQKDFNVFDRDKNGIITSDELDQVVNDPHTSAHDKLMAEVLQQSWFSQSYGEKSSPTLSKDDLQRIEIVYDPQYALAHEKLLDKYSDPITLLKGAIDNFDALSHKDRLDSTTIWDKENLNPEQRAIATELTSPDMREQLARYQGQLDGDQFVPPNWQLSKQDLQKMLDQEQITATGSKSQLFELAVSRADQDWVNYQKYVGKDIAASAGLMIPIAAATDLKATLFEYPSAIYSYYEDAKAKQAQAKTSNSQ